MPVVIQPYESAGADTRASAHLHLNLPNPGVHHDFAALRAPFNLRGTRQSASHEHAARWMISHESSCSPILRAALLRGYYEDREAATAYHGYLNLHHKQRDQISVKLHELATISTHHTVSLAGHPSFTLTLRTILNHLAQQPSRQKTG